MLHSLHYAFKTTIKNKNTFIWTLIFPIALATFMYLSFGNIYNDEFVMNTIPVAVEEGTLTEPLTIFLEGVKQENKEPYFEVKVMNEKDAASALESGEVDAIVRSESFKPSLIVGGDDFKHEVIVTVINAFNRELLVNGAMSEVSPVVIDEMQLAKGPQNVYNNFFYAIFGMGCLFSALGAVALTNKLMPGRTTLSGRLNIGATSKLKMVIAQMIVQLLVVFVAQMLGYFYMMLIGIELSTDIGAVAGIIAAGALFGISLGVLIGAIPRLSEGSKVGICVAVTMVLSFLADLCTAGIKDAIERNIPIINRLSPAALISDSFMTIYVYEDYDRYFRNLFTLIAMAVVLSGIAISILSKSRANKMMLKS